jgi:hypothetical protein
VEALAVPAAEPDLEAAVPVVPVEAVQVDPVAVRVRAEAAGPVADKVAAVAQVEAIKAAVGVLAVVRVETIRVAEVVPVDRRVTTAVEVVPAAIRAETIRTMVQQAKTQAITPAVKANSNRRTVEKNKLNRPPAQRPRTRTPVPGWSAMPTA